MQHTETHVQAHIERTSSAQFRTYTAQAIAAEHEDLAKEVTIRTRWYPWIAKVAPDPLLKTEQRFTELARSLFADYAEKVKRGEMAPANWVEDAKSRYSQEWESAGIVEAELMPPEVGGTLALAHNQASLLSVKAEQSKVRVLELIDQARSAESNLSQTRRDIAQQRGMNSAIEEFEIELEAKLQALNELRRRCDY